MTLSPPKIGHVLMTHYCEHFTLAVTLYDFMGTNSTSIQLLFNYYKHFTHYNFIGTTHTFIHFKWQVM